MKQRVLEENLARIGKVEPETILAPIHGPVWGYRQRARLSARYVASKGGALVGFRERRTHMVADMDSCEVLPRRISALIVPLRELVSEMELAARIPQIEIAVGDDATVLTVRVLDPPGDDDLGRLRSFARNMIWASTCRPGGRTPFAPSTMWLRVDSHIDCRSSTSSCSSWRPTSRRSTKQSIASW